MGRKAMRWRNLTIALAALAAPAMAQDDAVFGLWRSESGAAVVEIAPCGAQACGTVVALREPLDANGAPKTDVRNEDRALRDRRVCGLRLLSGFDRQGAGVWKDGEIYNAEDGKTYSAQMTVEGDSLRLRGYVGVPLFGKTQVWTRETPAVARC
jgi:uncharacterized protein (DUF2147 family)